MAAAPAAYAHAVQPMQAIVAQMPPEQRLPMSLLFAHLRNLCGATAGNPVATQIAGQRAANMIAQISAPQRDRIKALLREKPHHAITPEIRRELFSATARGEANIPAAARAARPEAMDE